MEHLNFEFSPHAAAATPDDGKQPVLVGVVSSGNLEVLVEPAPGAGNCRVEVETSVTGFGHVWQAVLADFVARHPLRGVRISINDAGATPAVVSLRLEQAAEAFRRGEA